MIVSAWLQFMIKDWFSHGRGDKDRAYRLPLSVDDGWPVEEMLVPRTVPDPTRPAGSTVPGLVNTLTHWWDLSSIYGTTVEDERRFRTQEGGRLGSRRAR